MCSGEVLEDVGRSGSCESGGRSCMCLPIANVATYSYELNYFVPVPSMTRWSRKQLANGESINPNSSDKNVNWPGNRPDNAVDTPIRRSPTEGHDCSSLG